MSSKTDFLALFDTSSSDTEDQSAAPVNIPSETVTTPNISNSVEATNSPSSIFREMKVSPTLDLLETPTYVPSSADVNSTMTQAKKQQYDDSVATFKSASSSTKRQEPNKKVQKLVSDPPDIMKFFNEESSTPPTFSKLQQRKNRSQKWQQAPAKKVKKTYPDSLDIPTGYSPPTYENGWDIEAVKALVEHAQASIDPSVTLSLERTLYAALQHSWMLALGGIGLMSVGENKRVPTSLGIMMLTISMISVVGALVMHYIRLFQIKSGTTFKFWQTALFTSLITLCVLITLALELYFGVLYPYLRRAMSVQVENRDED